MKEIQVDIFEVQLGAAMLLQFKRDEDGEDNWVSVLADAGIKASGYKPDHVHQKLPTALNKRHELRIDLIIGTHYDEDHLAGLVPIIEDNTISIGEAWMPPVANDTELHAFDQPFEDSDLLAHQFSDVSGNAQLERYLRKKREICNKTSRLITLSELDTEPRDSIFSEEQQTLVKWSEAEDSIDSEFIRYLRQARRLTGEDSGCLLNNTISDDLEQMVTKRGNYYRYSIYGEWDVSKQNTKRRLLDRWNNMPELKKRDIYNAASVQQSAAKDAINAKSLYKIVQALVKRGIPIRCRTIDNGEPRRFVWKPNEKKFIPSAQGSTDGPVLTLLGPSTGLVKKHWDKLPLGEYIETLFMKEIPLKGITPSNQLSYVMHFSHSGQGILVTGDAGCVDFKPNSRAPYYKKLLDQLTPLHVVQVAHHGGSNAHFYRVLLEAGYAHRDYLSYLLLSHATDDKHRPSNEFGKFVEQVRTDGTNDVSLLFTSRPQKRKIQDYLTLLHPVVGVQTAKYEGDVALTYSDMNGWLVIKHCVKVA